MILVVMGVCGCGKTTVGKILAEKLKCCFQDADDFHSEENKLKMSQGIPLTDEDRFPWLKSIHKFIKQLSTSGENGVVTCSALKKIYRTLLLTGDVTPDESARVTTSSVLFVYLHGDRAILETRLSNRSDHFMPAGLLQSQIETLEVPGDDERSITVDIDQRVDDIVAYILSHVKLLT